MESFNEIINQKNDDELLKMVYEFEEWNPEMLNAVEKELNNRNILPDDLLERKQIAIEEEDARLSEGRDASPFGFALGWLTVFGFLGIYIGYNYAFSKVYSRYTGEAYYKYNDISKKNGEYLFYTSLFLTALCIMYKVSR